MKGLWTKSEVAEYLGVSERTISRYIADRGLPAIAVSPGVVRFDMGDVLRWLRGEEVRGAMTPDAARGFIEGMLLAGADPEFIAAKVEALGIEPPTDVGYLVKED